MERLTREGIALYKRNILKQIKNAEVIIKVHQGEPVMVSVFIPCEDSITDLLDSLAKYQTYCELDGKMSELGTDVIFSGHIIINMRSNRELKAFDVGFLE